MDTGGGSLSIKQNAENIHGVNLTKYIVLGPENDLSDNSHFPLFLGKINICIVVETLPRSSESPIFSRDFLLISGHSLELNVLQNILLINISCKCLIRV